MDPRILELCRTDPRFAYEAYEFVCDAVTFTQERLGRDAGDDDPTDDHHISGGELLRGVCDLAVQQFGLMAPVVFKQWGVASTDDVGEMVFRLIGVKRLSKSERDDPADFRGLFDLHRVLAEGFAFTAAGDAPAKRGER